MIELLQSRYGFTRMPFGRDLPVQALHRHADHNQAVARITWCVTQHSLGVVTGEVGCGKTTAIRAAVTTLDATRHSIIYIGNPTLGPRGLFHHIVVCLGGRPEHGTAALTAQATDALAAEYAERGRLPVLLIDEAHLLTHDQLESIRMITNHEMDSAQPFAALLIGQPTLRRNIKLGVLAALDQRISVRCSMTGMTPTETSDYISTHLKYAGRSDTLFSDDAITLIHETARGKPRTVNNLAVQALLATLAAGKQIVDESATRTAITEIGATD